MGVLIAIIIVGGLIWLVKKGMEQAALNQAAQDAFKAEHQVATTPLIFIGGEAIGGSEQLANYLERAETGLD